MIHSKVMVVDDELLRVGSANLNNRSMGLDTECDLAFEAKSPEQRRAIVQLRDRMLGHFCGVGAKSGFSIARPHRLVDRHRAIAAQ